MSMLLLHEEPMCPSGALISVSTSIVSFSKKKKNVDSKDHSISDTRKPLFLETSQSCPCVNPVHQSWFLLRSLFFWGFYIDHCFLKTINPFTETDHSCPGFYLSWRHVAKGGSLCHPRSSLKPFSIARPESEKAKKKNENKLVMQIIVLRLHV